MFANNVNNNLVAVVTRAHGKDQKNNITRALEMRRQDQSTYSASRLQKDQKIKHQDSALRGIILNLLPDSLIMVTSDSKAPRTSKHKSLPAFHSP